MYFRRFILITIPRRLRLNIKSLHSATSAVGRIDYDKQFHIEVRTISQIHHMRHVLR